MSNWSCLWLQDPLSAMMGELTWLHDLLMAVLVAITFLLASVMADYVVCTYTSSSLLENQIVEALWTALPGLLLICIALPSLRILYLMEEMDVPLLTCKILASQWWWSYEYSNLQSGATECYISSSNSLSPGLYRLLEVDQRVCIPYNSNVRALISSMDVIHSWSMPSLGVKVDANPGRVNQSLLSVLTPGVLHGSCAEVCGANHSFMPIVLEALSPPLFTSWVMQST